MAILSNDKGAIRFLKALGVECKGVRKAVITLEVDKPVMVEIERYAEPHQFEDDGELVRFIGKYTLTEIEPPSDE